MQEYIFVRTVPIVNRDKGISELVEKGTVRVLSIEDALPLIQMACITKYTKPEPVKLTVKQIKEKLDSNNIKYDKNAKKDELLELLNQNGIR